MAITTAALTNATTESTTPSAIVTAQVFPYSSPLTHDNCADPPPEASARRSESPAEVIGHDPYVRLDEHVAVVAGDDENLHPVS